jgi:hypothetical protein
MRQAVPAILVVAAVLAACQPTSPESSLSPMASPSPSVSPSASPTAEPSLAPTGWREITPSGGPVAREDHTWTVNAAETTAYLFGGRNSDGSDTFADLWAYDLDTDSWQALPATGPAARFGHSAAWVGGVGLVIFAGQAGATFFNDLWAFDPETQAWRQLPAGGAPPVPRYGSCAAVGPDGRLWISHGFTSAGARFDDTRAYTFATGTWTDETPVGEAPIRRCLHGCWWSDAGFNLYAGQTDGVTALGDWWTLTVGPRPGTNAWTEVAIGGSGLPARNLYALTGFRGGHLVFGGQGTDGGYLADGWLIDHEGAPAAAPAGPPAPTGRSGAEMVTDVTRDRVLLFGGRDAANHYADVWELTAP